MPIVVDPGFAWPPEVDPVVSPDGRLTAIVDPAHAGVLLRANFDDSVPDTPAQPEKVLRRNLVTNPSFESGITGWSARYAGIKSVTQTSNSWGIASGSYALQVEGGSTASAVNALVQSPIIPVNAGEWVAVAASMRCGLSTMVSARLRLYWTDASGADSESNRTDVSGYTPLTGNGNNAPSSRYRGETVQVPSGAAGFRLAIWYRAPDGVSAPPANFVAHVDAVHVATGTKADATSDVATYFDGSNPASGSRRYRYTSVGTSEEYVPATPFIPGKPGTVAQVRFERQDGTLVRSGNPAWAPGGYAHAYDHEATLGGGTLWRAVPIRFDGREGTPSEYVGAVIPPLSDGWAWLKPVADPDKAMLLKVEPPDLSYDGRVDTTSIAGAPRPAATWDVLEGFTTQLRSLVREKNAEEQLMALLDEGPVLAQFPACAGLPDFYFIRGKLDLEHVHWDGWPWRRYQWDVIQIDRPDTTDSPLRIPGLSYDTVARDWTTYDQLRSTVESYNKLLEP